MENDLNQEAVRIADAIDASVDACLNGDLDMEVYCAQTKALWDEARTKGLDSQVDRILQEKSSREMEEALANLPESVKKYL
jgi:hypothetical protein